jgi:hypothetical protein
MFYLTFSNYSFIVNIDLFKDLSVPNVQSFKVIVFKQLIMQGIVFKESYFFYQSSLCQKLFETVWYFRKALLNCDYVCTTP